MCATIRKKTNDSRRDKNLVYINKKSHKKLWHNTNPLINFHPIFHFAKCKTPRSLVVIYGYAQLTFVLPQGNLGYNE
jgi:hypothetical protein